jgi:hypothetical protein
MLWTEDRSVPKPQPYPGQHKLKKGRHSYITHPSSEIPTHDTRISLSRALDVRGSFETYEIFCAMASTNMVAEQTFDTIQEKLKI